MLFSLLNIKGVCINAMCWETIPGVNDTIAEGICSYLDRVKRIWYL